MTTSTLTFAEEIIDRCNNYAVASGLHVANVAYVPKKPLEMSSGDSNLWKMIDGKLILNDTITVFPKENLRHICVTYMKNPVDEMDDPDEEVPEFVMFGTNALKYRVKLSTIRSYHVQGGTSIYIHYQLYKRV